MATFRLLFLILLLSQAGWPSRADAQCNRPTGLSVTNIAFPSATLNWSPVSGASAYAINVQNSSGNQVPFNINLLSVTTSVDVTNFPVEGNYKFKVRAICGGNNSNWSSKFEFTVGNGGGGGGNCTNLGIPAGLTVTAIAFPSATLGWGAVTGADSYSVNVQNSNGNTTPLDSTFTVVPNSVVFAAFPVEGNYKFKVRVLCGANTGSWSPNFEFSVGNGGGGGGGGNCSNLGVPTGLNVTNVAFPSATLGWNAAAGATSYAINVQNGSGNPVPFNLNITSATTSVDVTNFPAPGNYKFKVRALCGGNTGSWSPKFEFSVGNGGGGGGGGNCSNPSTPTGLNVTGIAFPSATLAWNAASGTDSYRVNVQSNNNNPSDLDSTFTVTTTSVVFSAFPIEGDYKFKVRGLCGAETGSWSDDFEFTVGTGGGGGGGGNCSNLGVPTGLNVTNVAFPSATLGWNAATGATSYAINVQNGSGNPVPFNINLTSATTSIDVTNFPAPGNYKFKVRALCGGNTGSWSPVFNFSVGNGGGGGGGGCSTLGIPGGLSATNIAFPSATLGWNAAAGADSYSVNVQNANGNPTQLDSTFTVNGTSAVFAAFPVEGNYKFKVRALCGTNTGDWSPNFEFSVGNGGGGGGGGGCGTLGIPDGLSATNIAFPSATLGWNAAAGADSYSVNVQNANGNPTQLDSTFTVNGTSVVFAAFPVVGNYKFKVRALCGANTGDWSPDFDFTVTAAAPLVPNKFIAGDKGTVSGFSVYPNPTHTRQAALQLNDFEGQTITVKVFDWAGKQVYADNPGTWAGGTYMLDLQHTHQVGVYVVEVMANGQRFAQKLLLAGH